MNTLSVTPKPDPVNDPYVLESLGSLMDGRWLPLNPDKTPVYPWADDHVGKAANRTLASTQEAIDHKGPLGVHPGHAYFIVADVDSRGGVPATKENPITPEEAKALIEALNPFYVAQTRKGLHLYFDARDGEIVGNQQWEYMGFGGDLRGHKGYVMVHDIGALVAMKARKSGVQFMKTIEPQYLDVGALLSAPKQERPQKPAQAPQDRPGAPSDDTPFIDHANALTYTQRACEGIMAEPEGNRNNKVNIASHTVSSKCGAPDINESELKALLYDAAQAAEQGRATVDSGWGAGEALRRPRTAPEYVSELTVAEEDEEPKERPYRRRSASEIYDPDMKPLDWIVQDHFPRGFATVLSAPSGDGKSTFARDLCRKIADPTVGKALGRPCATGPCLYLALEESGRSINRWLMKTGSQHLPIDFIQESEVWPWLTEECEGMALVVVDVMTDLVPMEDGNSYTETKRKLKPLIKVARDSGCHLLVLHHTAQGFHITNKYARLNESPLGSTGIGAAFDNKMSMSADREALTTKYTIHGRDGIDVPMTTLAFDPETLRYSHRGTSAQNAHQSDIHKLVAFIGDETKQDMDGLTSLTAIKGTKGKPGAGLDSNKVRGLLDEAVALGLIVEVVKRPAKYRIATEMEARHIRLSYRDTDRQTNEN